MGEFVIFSFCLTAAKFDAIDWPVLQLSFIWQAKENTSSRCESGLPKRCKEKRGWRLNFVTSFYVFLLPTSLPYVNWASQEGCFVSPKVLSWVLWPSFVLFSLSFPIFVFKPLLLWTPFSYSNYLTVLILKGENYKNQL